MKKEITIAPYSVGEVKNNIEYCIPKAITLLHCQELWDKGITGKGIKIAVLDSGCDIDHPCLKDRIVNYKNVISNNDDVHDGLGHGTHVAGIIAGNRVKMGVTGVAPDSELIIVKVLTDKGNGSLNSLYDGIEYAVAMGANIINMSLGGAETNEFIHMAIKRATSLGIPVVCASGNNGDGNSETDEISYPAFYDETIEVGSIDFSNSIANFSNSNCKMNVVTYGKNITSTYPNNKYAVCSGTSQSAPHITGILALLMQKFIIDNGRKPEERELYNELRKYCKELSGVGIKSQGDGRVEL